MGTFSNLKPDSPENVAFWEEHKGKVQELLTQLNDEVFNGKWELQENYRSIALTENMAHSYLEPEMHVYLEYIVVHVARGGGMLHVVGAIRNSIPFGRNPYFLSYREEDITPSALVAGISRAAKYILDTRRI